MVKRFLLIGEYLLSSGGKKKICIVVAINMLKRDQRTLACCYFSPPSLLHGNVTMLPRKGFLHTNNIFGKNVKTL